MAPITAKPESGATPPARPGLRRPADFPAEPPIAALAEPKFPRDYKTRTLTNGLKVYVVSKHQVPYISITLGSSTGAWTEATVPEPGTILLLGSGLLGLAAAGKRKRVR